MPNRVRASVLSSRNGNMLLIIVLAPSSARNLQETQCARLSFSLIEFDSASEKTHAYAHTEKRALSLAPNCERSVVVVVAFVVAPKPLAVDIWLSTSDSSLASQIRLSCSMSPLFRESTQN